MMHEARPNRGASRPDIYQFVLQRQLIRQWSDWFDGFAITLDEHGQTILFGPVIDQAALHGMLKKVRDLGMPLISVQRLEPGEEAASQNVIYTSSVPLIKKRRGAP